MGNGGMTQGGWTALSRRPRLDDVAARVGLSPASVSLVLRNAPGPSEATRERVFRAAAELGYRADMTASLLARHRTNLLGGMLDVRKKDVPGVPAEEYPSRRQASPAFQLLLEALRVKSDTGREAAAPR